MLLRRFMRQAFLAMRKTHARKRSGSRSCSNVSNTRSIVSCATSSASSRWPHISQLYWRILGRKRATKRSKASGLPESSSRASSESFRSKNLLYHLASENQARSQLDRARPVRLRRDDGESRVSDLHVRRGEGRVIDKIKEFPA